MNDKFTEDFIKEQLNVMEKFEKADCSPSPEYIAGRNAAIKNYVDALRKISSLEHEIRSWCRDMSTVFDDGIQLAIDRVDEKALTPLPPSEEGVVSNVESREDVVG